MRLPHGPSDIIKIDTGKNVVLCSYPKFLAL